MEEPSEQELSYLSINSSSDARATIVLLHGASSSPTEYKLATPFFPTTYHLLIPSLPHHASSKNIRPFTLPLTSTLLATLIHTHAQDGRAHIVGVSLGAHVALHFAAQHPDLVLTVFVSGYGRVPPPSQLIASLAPYVLYGSQRVTNAVPKPVVRFFMSGASLDLEGTGTYDVQLCRELIDVLCATEEIAPVRARCLVVAATKRGLVPSDDSVEEARLVGRAVRGAGGNIESRVVQMRSMRHPWDMQAPELFANCVVAWIEGRELPKEMEKVET